MFGGPAAVRKYLPTMIDLIYRGEINPGAVFDLVLPLEQAAEGYAAMVLSLTVIRAVPPPCGAARMALWRPAPRPRQSAPHRPTRPIGPARNRGVLHYMKPPSAASPACRTPM